MSGTQQNPLQRLVVCFAANMLSIMQNYVN